MEQKPVGAASPQDEPHSLRILVADDQVIIADNLSILLRSWGHEVQIAHNGPDALHGAVDFRPQVIVLDIGLPDMNGYEVARRIRQDAHINGSYLIAITGYVGEEERQRSKEAGFDVHLVKPVDADELKELLAEIRPKDPA